MAVVGVEVEHKEHVPPFEDDDLVVGVLQGHVPSGSVLCLNEARGNLKQASLSLSQEGNERFTLVYLLKHQCLVAF